MTKEEKIAEIENQLRYLDANARINGVSGYQLLKVITDLVEIIKEDQKKDGDQE